MKAEKERLQREKVQLEKNLKEKLEREDAERLKTEKAKFSKTPETNFTKKEKLGCLLIISLIILISLAIWKPWKTPVIVKDNLASNKIILPDDVKKINNRAIGLFENKNYDSAKVRFYIVIERIPQFPLAYANVAASWFNNYLTDKSKKSLLDSSIYYNTRAIELDETCNTALYNRAKIYMETGKYDEAIKDFNQVLYQNNAAELFDLEGRYIFQVLGYCYLQLNNYNMAVEELKKQINQDHTNVLTFFYLAIAYYKLNDFSEAKNFYRRAINESITFKLPIDEIVKEYEEPNGNVYNMSKEFYGWYNH